MSTTNEEINNWAKKNQQMQLLYSIVHASLKEMNKTKDKQLKEKSIIFEDTLISLIQFISDNGIPAESLTMYLIIIINKSLLTQDEAELASIIISKLHKNVDKMINSMIILRGLCQEEDFRTAICHIQAEFASNFISNTESPIYPLEQQLQLWQLHLSKGESDPQFTKAKAEVPEIQSQMDTIHKNIQTALAFCEQYKVTARQ